MLKLNLHCGCEDSFSWQGFLNFYLLEPDMPKGVRIVASLPASKISSRKSDGHPLVTIALFSGLGLLVTFIAILCGMQGAWF